MKREKYIDVLKVIGLLGIMLAHVQPPEVLFQLRNFDVVLMILVSAYLGLQSKKSEKLISYLIKRFKRLVIPTWIFISFFLLLKLLVGNFDISLKDVFGTYALSDFGIGYVWIIRIYFIVAILVPLYKSLDTKLNELQILVMSLPVFICYEYLCRIGLFNNKILDYLLAYFIPCFLLLALAKLFFENSRWNITITFISFIIFVVYAAYLYRINGHFVPTQDYKYPFQLYYLSFGVFISGLLIRLTKKLTMSDYFYNKIILFMSSHSLWIYLWHILVLTMVNHFSFPWYFKFVIVVVVASVITVIQDRLVKRLQDSGQVNTEILNVFKG